MSFMIKAESSKKKEHIGSETAPVRYRCHGKKPSSWTELSPGSPVALLSWCKHVSCSFQLIRATRRSRVLLLYNDHKGNVNK